MPRPAAIAAAPTPEKLDALLDQVEHAINALNEAWQQHGDSEEYRAAEEPVMAHLAQLRDLVRSFLKEHEAGRPGLTNVFGEETGRRYRLQVVFQSCNELLTDEARQDSAGRWESSLAVYESLEHALAPPDAEDQQPIAPPFQGGAASTTAAQEEAEPTSAPAEPVVETAPEDPPNINPPKVEQNMDAQYADTDEGQAGQQAITMPLSQTGLPMDAAKPGAPHADPKSEKAPSNPQREMRGELTLENGVKYTGEWCGAVRDGEGVEVRPDGSSYMGQFVMGQAHGKGIYTQPDGLTIAGHWIGGKLNGSGLESHPDGTTYEGQYNEGVKSGFGTYTYEEGSVYEGQFCNDGMHGNGIYISANGDHGGRYQGEWNENRMHGTGLFKVPDGRKYDGEYAYDRRNGTGTFTWPDGRVHEGQWRAGKMHGVGKAVFPDGNEKLGEWQDGKLLRWEDHAQAMAAGARGGALGLASAAHSAQARTQPAVITRHEEEARRKRIEEDEAARQEREAKEAAEAERRHREMMAYGEQQAARLQGGGGIGGSSAGAVGGGIVDSDGRQGVQQTEQQGEWLPPDDETNSEVPAIPS